MRHSTALCRIVSRSSAWDGLVYYVEELGVPRHIRAYAAGELKRVGFAIYVRV